MIATLPSLGGPGAARPLSESEIRALRDQVFGHPSSDNNWEGCRENWLRPESTAWLIARAKLETRNSKP